MYYRRFRITEPNNGSQTFLFCSLCTTLWSGGPWLPCELPASVVPGNLPQGSTIDTNAQMLNSFHWNQAQNADIPTDLSQLTTNHMNKARMRHWLSRDPTGYSYAPDFALSSEEAPSQSQDGSDVGQFTFYDYAGKSGSSSWAKGTQIQPSLVAWKLPDGSTAYMAFQRNSFGLPTSETSTYGTGNPASTRTYSHTYAANDQDVVEWRGPSNELLATYAYNARHQMTNEVLWADSTISYTNSWAYDQQGRLQSMTTAAGQTTTFTNNGSSGSYSGYLSGIAEQPVQRTQSLTWFNGRVYAHTDYRGLTVTNFWDGLGRLTGRLYPDGTTTTNLYSRAAAYPGGTGGLNILDVTATRDRLGRWTYFDYDSLRRTVARTNANGVVTRYGYCDCGSANSITNAWGSPVQQVTLFTFDNQGNRVLENYADGYAVTNWFNAPGQAVARGDGTGYHWYFYNNQGLLTTVSNACGLEKDIIFDIRDRPEYVTDANGVTVVNAYDNLGRLLGRGYPDNGVETFGYSARGLVAYTNQIGLSNFFVYDAAARKTFETNGNGEVIRYTNSAAGDLLSLTDGKSQTTRWTYDLYGRATNKLDQAGTEILRYKYDAESRLTNRWTAAKGNTGYGYDGVGNLTNINYPTSPDVALQYDWLNRLTNMVDAAGTTKYAYTAGNQLLSEDGPFASDIVTNTYANRLRTALSLQQPSGLWTNQFVYDAAGRLTNVTSSAGSHGYMLGGSGAGSPLIKKLLLPNTSYITNTYGAVARLTGTFLNNSGNTTLDSSTYGYNVASQRTTFTNAAATYVGYTYDKIGQLKIADSSVSSEDRGYTYDSAWNLNYLTNNGVASTFTVDSRNQLTSTPVGAASYDSNGNLASYVHRYGSGTLTRTCAYDDENRLVSVYSGTVYRTDFAYDGLGRMRKRTTFSWNGSSWVAGAVVEYIYDGWRVIQERDGNNLPTVSYTRGTDLSGSLEGAGGIGGLLARSSGYSSGNWTNHNFYHADGNGNIMYLVNSSQTQAAAYRYDPFGNTIGSSGSLAAANVYRFSSKEIHLVDSYGSPPLYYYGYRFYDPSLQRWLNRDPVAERGGLNLYAFLRNDPLSKVDPRGLNPAAAGGIVLGGTITVGQYAGLTVLACLAIPPCRDWLLDALGKAVDKVKELCKRKNPPPDDICNCVCPSGAFYSYPVPKGAPCRPIQNILYDWVSTPEGKPILAPVGEETCACAK
jgi:RHS repeat-associated protein